MREVLIETEEYVIWDDGTYLFKMWQDKTPSLWKIEDGNYYWKHPRRKTEWRISTEEDRSYKEGWANKIMTILLERELFNE